MIIEKFKIKDYKEVYSLWKRSGFYLGLSDKFEGISDFLARNPETFLVGRTESTNTIIGVIMGGFDGRRGLIHHLAIESDYQNKGFGSLLLEAVLNKFREKGVVKVHLFIEKNNSDVVNVTNFYKKNGWVKRDDLFVMSKTLRER